MVTRNSKQKTQQVQATVEPKDWREADTRSERSRLIREGLLEAAAEIVGTMGYQEASVTLITQRAGVAQGTFYNHFQTRQDILDQLLPAMGRELLAYVGECAKKGETMLEKEELQFSAFFSFLQKRPHFFRILNEAESFAPKAYYAHLELVSQGYTRFFQRAHEDGELPNFERRELKVVALILMATRSYLAWRYMYGSEQSGEIPKWVTKAYMKFVRSGLSSTAWAEPRKLRNSPTE